MIYILFREKIPNPRRNPLNKSVLHTFLEKVELLF